MFSLKSVYDGCRNRLQKDNFGARLWAILCVALFVIALAVSMLGCSGITPSTGAPTAGSDPAGFPGGIDSMGGRFSSGALLGLQIQNEQIRPYFGGN